MNRVLAVRGRVVPATATVITLCARLQDGTEVDGQSRIARTNDVDRVWVTPEDVRPTDDALQAIADAELIVIGPGSLFTSLLPALVVPGIREAIAASGALVVFVCNVATQPGETGGFDLADHLDALDRHGAGHLPDIVLANNRFDAHAADGLAGPARQAPLAVGREPGPRGWCSTTSSTRTTPTTTTRSGSRPPSSAPGSARAATGAGPACPAPTGRPEQRIRRIAMSGTDRDLVDALRAELAAVDAARPCDRQAEIAGLGARIQTREPAVARLVVRLGGGRSTARSTRAPTPGARSSCPRRRSPGRPPPSTAGWPGCAAGSSPAAR